MDTSQRSHYRPDIDGLRAVAVSMVVVFHAFPRSLPGGFIGVDIFFVISGYLITGIIAREIATGSFRISSFYDRRIRRIFPALAVVLAAVFLAGWRLLLPQEFKQLGLNIFAGAAFFSNIASLMQAGYFDLESSKKPLLHLWSLGIEEQFYLAWPLILLVAARYKRSLKTVILIIGGASFLLNVALIAHDPIGTFYLPFTRAWELLAGALLAVMPDRRPEWSNARSVIGVGLICAAAILLTPKSQFPGWWAVLPVCGSALVLSSPDSFISKLALGSRPFVGLGLISYPLYLWHWPLLVFGALANFDPLDFKQRLFLVAASLLLAFLTYSLVEVWFRRGTPNFLKLATPLAGMFAAGCLGIAAVAGDGLESRFPEQIRALAKEAVQADRWRVNECTLNVGDTHFSEKCVDNARPLLFVWGDSTGSALMPGLLDLQKERGFGLAQFTISSCEPLLPEYNLSPRSDCGVLNKQALATLERVRPNIILLEAIWHPSQEHLEALEKTVAYLKARGFPHIVVLGRVPSWDGGLQSQVVNYFLVHRAIPERLAQPPKSNWYDLQMRTALEAQGVKFISAWDAFCDDRGCLATTDGKARLDITATDQIHLTEAGSDFLIRSIAPALFEE